MFPGACKLFRRCYGHLEWCPTFPVWPEKGWVPGSQLAQASPAMYQPGAGVPKYMTDAVTGRCNIILTSCGFLTRYRRGLRAGLGWGQFDSSTDWRMQGRRVTEAMLEMKFFRKTFEKPTSYFLASGRQLQAQVTTERLLAQNRFRAAGPRLPGKTFRELLTGKNRTRTREETQRRRFQGRWQPARWSGQVGLKLSECADPRRDISRRVLVLAILFPG